VGPTFNLQDPALADFLGIGGSTDAGVNVTERTTLGLTAAWRAVKLTSGVLAGLPLKTYRTDSDGQRVQVGSVFDNPGGAFYTPFEWKQQVFAHLLLHGNAYLLHIYNGAGSLDSLIPIHPSLVTVKVAEDKLSREYHVTADGMTKVYTEADLTHDMSLSLDGNTGLSPIAFERNALGTGIAGDKAAGRMFANGLLIGGIVTSDETLDEDDAKTILTGLKAKVSGANNAGDIAIVNASLKFQPWTMNAEDAQFLESRQYQVAEVARIFGVPVQLLMQDGASSWGSGIQELVRGWQKFDLTGWTAPFEERCSRLLADTRFCEFDYQGLNQGSPAEEIGLLVQQITVGLLTVDEARAIRNMPPLPTGGGEAPAGPGSEGNPV
jgi:HK97 family phage portal protein